MMIEALETLPPSVVMPQRAEGESGGSYIGRCLQAVREWAAAREYDRQRRGREDVTFGTGPLMPTPERAQHDPVEKLEKPIADEDGAISRPYRTVDSVERMLRTGTIDGAAYAAAVDFRNDFHMGQLQQLRAVEMGRIKGGGREPQYGAGAMDARDRIHGCMLALGGRSADPTSSAAASAVWYVVGLGDTLKDWARRMRWGAGRSMREEAASAILATALQVLAGHYEREGAGMAQRAQRRGSMGR